MVVIEIDGIKAILQNSKWESEDNDWQELLTDWTESKIASGKFSIEDPFFGLYSPANPWPDWTIASEVIKRFGGEIIESVPPKYKYSENRIY